MFYLLDTNVVSKTVRRSPEPTVTEWLESIQADALHVSILTLIHGRAEAELREHVMGPNARSEPKADHLLT